MASSGKECGVCNERFRQGDNWPRILPCSHCLCSECIDQLIRMKKQTCPFCHRNFRGKSASAFVINSNLLDLLKYVADLESVAGPSHGVQGTSLTGIKLDSKELSKENTIHCQKAKAQIQTAISSNSELKSCIRQVTGKIKIVILTKLKEIEERSERQIGYLEEENERLEMAFEELSGWEEQIRDADAKMEAARSITAATPIVDKTNRFSKDFKTSRKELKDFLSENERKRHNMKKFVEKSEGRITLIQEALSSTEEEEEVDQYPNVIDLPFKNNTQEDVMEIAVTKHSNKMAESSLEHSGTKSKRPRLLDVSKCLICQETSEEKLPLPSAKSVGRLKEVAEIRKDDISKRLKEQWSSAETPTTWHLSCYNNYTRKVNVERHLQGQKAPKPPGIAGFMGKLAEIQLKAKQL